MDIWFVKGKDFTFAGWLVNPWHMDIYYKKCVFSTASFQQITHISVYISSVSLYARCGHHFFSMLLMLMTGS